MKLVSLTSLAVLALSMAGFCSALQPVHAAEFVVSVEVGRMAYHALETGVAGKLLNQEDGVLPTRRLGSRWEHGAWHMDLSVWQAGQEIAYSGFSQVGFPLQLQTQLNAQGMQWRAGYAWPWVGDSAALLSVGVDQLQIDRNLRPSPLSSALREKMDSTRALLGAGVVKEWTALPGWPLQVSVGVDVLRSLRQRLAVDSFGLYEPITLSPANSTDWRTTLRMALAPSASSKVWLTVEREGFNPGSTPYQAWTPSDVPATLVRYPGSRQSLQSLSIGASWQF